MLNTRPLSVCIVVVLSLVFAIAVSGCGAAAGVGAVTSNIVGGFAVKGPIIDGTVFAYVQNSDGSKGALLSEGTTDDRGAFELSIDDYSGCVRLEVVSGTYTDEATGRIVDLAGEGIVLLGLVPDYDPETGLTDISITPLTSIAASLAIETLEEGGGDPAVAAATANAQVASYFGLDDIINTPPPDLTNEDDPYDGEMDDAAAAAVIIAGLSELAADSGVSAMELVDALAEDYSDGVFDGAADGETVALGGMDLSADLTTTELASGIEDFVESENNTSAVNSEDVSDVTDIVAGGGGAPPPIPSIAYLSLIEGDIGGGTQVTIFGEHLDLVTLVLFGENDADILGAGGFTKSRQGETALTVMSPPGDEDGAVPVTVMDANGLGDSLADAFTYISVRQAIVSTITENWGSFGGGTNVTITGEYFEPDALVYFGAAAATGVVVASPTQLTGTVPAGEVGTADVIVANPGVPQGVLADGFTYTYGDVKVSGKAWCGEGDFQTAADNLAFSPEGENVCRHWYYNDSDGNGLLLFTTAAVTPYYPPVYEPVLVYDADGYGHMAFYDAKADLWYGHTGDDKKWGTGDDLWSVIYEYLSWDTKPALAVDSSGAAAVLFYDDNSEELYLWFDSEGDHYFDPEETYDFVAAAYYNADPVAVFSQGDELAVYFPTDYDETNLWVDANGDFVADEGEVCSYSPPDGYSSIENIDLAIDPDGVLGGLVSYNGDMDTESVLYWYDANGDFVIDTGEVVVVSADMFNVCDVSLIFDADTAGYPAVVGYIWNHIEGYAKGKAFAPPLDYTYYGQWTDADDDGAVDEGELVDDGFLFTGTSHRPHDLDLVWTEIDGATCLAAAYIDPYDEVVYYMVDGADTGSVDGLLDPENELLLLDYSDVYTDNRIAFAADGDGVMRLVAVYHDYWMDAPAFPAEFYDEAGEGLLSDYRPFGLPLYYKLYASYYNAADGTLTTPTGIEGGLEVTEPTQPIVMFDAASGDAVIVYTRYNLVSYDGLQKSFNGHSADALQNLYCSEFDFSAGAFQAEATAFTSEFFQIDCYGFVSDGLNGPSFWNNDSTLSYYPYLTYGESGYIADYNGFRSESKQPCEFSDYLGVVALVADYEYEDYRLVGWAWSPGNSFGPAQFIEPPADAVYDMYEWDTITTYNGSAFFHMQDDVMDYVVYWATFDGTDFSDAVRLHDSDGADYSWTNGLMIGEDEGLDAPYVCLCQQTYDGEDWITDLSLVKLDEASGTFTYGAVASSKDADFCDVRVSRDGDYLAILYYNQDESDNYRAYARVFDLPGSPDNPDDFTPGLASDGLQVSDSAYVTVYKACFQKNLQGDNSLLSFWYCEGRDVCLFNQLNYNGTDLTLAIALESDPVFCGEVGRWYGGDYYWLNQGKGKPAGKSLVAEYAVEFDMWDYEELSVQVYDDGAGGAVIYYLECASDNGGETELFASRYFAGSGALEDPVLVSNGLEVEYYIVRTIPDPLVATTHHVLWAEYRDEVESKRGLNWRSFDIGAQTLDAAAFEPAADVPGQVIDEDADMYMDSDFVSAWVDISEDLLVVYYTGEEFTLGDMYKDINGENERTVDGGGIKDDGDDGGKDRMDRGKHGGGDFPLRIRSKIDEPIEPTSKVCSRLFEAGAWDDEVIISLDDPEWGAAFNGVNVLCDHTTASMLNYIGGGETFGDGDIVAFILILNPNEDYEEPLKKIIEGDYIEYPAETRLFVRIRR